MHAFQVLHALPSGYILATHDEQQLLAIRNLAEERDCALGRRRLPCNQFGEQEPGTPAEIESFCTKNYGVTFPLMEKIDVKGERRHDIYAVLSDIPDGEGKAGDVQWNFEKFLVSADGNRIQRFRPQVKPDDPAIIAAIEVALPKENKR